MHKYWEWFNSTPSVWWHDSANPDEIDRALSNGAQGVTTNPVLTYKTFEERKEFWQELVATVPTDIPLELRAEELLKLVAKNAADRAKDIYERTNKKQGYALGQLNPNNAGNAEKMLEQAHRLRKWGENIIVKLPTSKAGLEVIDTIGAQGMNVCATVNVSVAQAVAVADVYENACQKAVKNGIEPGFCIVVQQVGRVEDYIRLLAAEARCGITDDDINMSGIAMTKRTIELLDKKTYSHCVIMPGGLRTPEQLVELAGAHVTFTLHPRFQHLVEECDMPMEIVCDRPIAKDSIERLRRLPEFIKLYEPDGLSSEEFLSFGCVQKVISHFLESGWARLETYGLGNIVSSHWT